MMTAFNTFWMIKWYVPSRFSQFYRYAGLYRHSADIAGFFNITILVFINLLLIINDKNILRPKIPLEFLQFFCSEGHIGHIVISNIRGFHFLKNVLICVFSLTFFVFLLWFTLAAIINILFYCCFTAPWVIARWKVNRYAIYTVLFGSMKTLSNRKNINLIMTGKDTWWQLCVTKYFKLLDLRTKVNLATVDNAE